MISRRSLLAGTAASVVVAPAVAVAAEPKPDRILCLDVVNGKVFMTQINLAGAHTPTGSETVTINWDTHNGKTKFTSGRITRDGHELQRFDGSVLRVRYE